MRKTTRLQSAIRALYPPQCVACGVLTESEFALCGSCWRDTHFISGLVCHHCGIPLPGEDRGEDILCDDCLQVARPWAAGRAVLLYRDTGRRLVLALKHGDRTDLARPAGAWMAKAAAPLLRPDMLAVPVPLHPWRLFRRRYNQAALLAGWLAHEAGIAHLPDALVRTRRTRPLDGHTRAARFAALDGAIAVHPRRAGRIAGRPVLLVDDVMTSGATLAAATGALLSAGAGDVVVQVLARVGKDA
ncbi:MAG: ComF family protein [Rubellimicrobium sp.]|nr:ComF family protein [Rubellimicrobium sp.]